ncbi:uncharacterized protein V6R79_021228 [Siganus canaliculatus]
MSCPHPPPCAMPKSDTWPGGIAIEPLSSMESSGSCDSVISVNSGCSEDSMEHLSAEERACLMYLEETIEALEVQEDSGLSNDEPDPVLQAERMGQIRANDDSEGDQSSDKSEIHAVNETLEPQSSPVFATKATEQETSETELSPPGAESVMSGEIHPIPTQSEVLCLSEDGAGDDIQIVSSSSQSTEPKVIEAEPDLGLIPPPSDFMDDPELPPQPEAKEAQELPPSPVKPNNKPAAKVDLEKLRKRASQKKTSVSSPGSPDLPNKPPELSPSAVSPVPQSSLPHPDTVEPKSPPAVAPKPKKLPANIILKSHKASAADSSSGHSLSTSNDRVLLDPQKVRIEALRKLGLLKSEEVDSGPVLSPKHSPKTRKSWATPPSPVSPAAPQTPPLTPTHTRLSSLSPAPVSPQPLQAPSGPSAAPTDLPPAFLPAPAAFSDPDGQDVSGLINTPVNTPPRTPPALIKKQTPPQSVKSATLERSGLGLSNYMSSEDSSETVESIRSRQSPGQLRNNRPRPASLGSRQEFPSGQGEGLQLGHVQSKEPDLRKSLPAFQQHGDSQNLPRSQGISVLICPRAENGDDRREALRRLGLLRN